MCALIPTNLTLLIDVTTKLDSSTFQHTDTVDQQVISRISLPIPIMETYKQCEPPPDLNSLNPYREDGKACLSFYTDPEFFFRRWLQEMQAEAQTTLQKKREKKVGT